MNFPPFFLTLGGAQPALVNARLAAPIFLPFSAGTHTVEELVGVVAESQVRILSGALALHGQPVRLLGQALVSAARRPPATASFRAW